MSTLVSCPLVIGSVTLSDNFESPDGQGSGVSDLGSTQKAVVHEFPGGIVSAQLFGSFPKLITWTGKLIGIDAFSRSMELQALCDKGDEITFSWGAWYFDGFVKDYKAIGRGPYWIDYEISFRPLENNSSLIGKNAPNSANPFAPMIAPAIQAATQQATAPASGGALPGSVAPAVATLTQNYANALQQAGGVLGNIPAATQTVLQGQISAIQDALLPVINGSDPLAASAAADLNGTLATLNTALTDNANDLITTINVSNPNLYQLSQQYYGSPLYYGTIQAANDLSDPLPITNGPIQLKIPVKPIPNSITPLPTIVTDAVGSAA